MKLLVLSCNTGQGHNSAASAVKECFINMGHSCEIKDALSYTSKWFSDGVSKSYNKIVLHAPKAFGVGYRYSKSIVYNPGKLKSAAYGMNMLYSKQLYLDLIKGGYDAVICTHLFAAQSITHVKHKHNFKIPAFVVSTDYSYRPFFDELDVEGYFISMPEVIHEYLARKLPEDKIYPYGIPVAKRFTVEVSKNEARQQLGIGNDGFISLIMSGSMGFGNIYDVIDELLANDFPEHKIIIIAGKNKKLLKGIKYRYAEYDNVTCIGFTDKVHLYMKACDVVISKPGGLSSTEAMVSNIPLVLSEPIPGCESENFELLTKLGAALSGRAINDVVSSVKSLMEDKNLYNSVIEKQNRYINKNAAQNICECVIDYVNKH